VNAPEHATAPPVDELDPSGPPMPAFLDLEGPEHAVDRAAAVVLPVPYDATSTWIKGADRGPRALLDASTQVELWECVTGTEPSRHGIATAEPIRHDGGPDVLAELVEAAVGPVLGRGAVPVVLGGEHSVSIGAFRAAARAFSDLTIVQLDAHADTRETYHGSPCNHACVMARARELCPIVQVGIRSLDASEVAGLDPHRVLYAHRLHALPEPAWLERISSLIGPKVYLTVDLDVLDPSALPATGTPEPGGLSWLQLTAAIRRIARVSEIVGFDVVELCPAPGHHASAFTAAKLVQRTLAEIFAARPPHG